jgi:hypothetical protein
MGSNWKEYLNEGFRVLRFNGEMIISESGERYSMIKAHIEGLGYRIKIDKYTDTNRWFYLHVLNDKVEEIERVIELDKDIAVGKKKNNIKIV